MGLYMQTVDLGFLVDVRLSRRETKQMRIPEDGRCVVVEVDFDDVTVWFGHDVGYRLMHIDDCHFVGGIADGMEWLIDKTAPNP
jgi:hypothetical protein